VSYPVPFRQPDLPDPFTIFPEIILRIYSNDDAVIALGAEYMRIFSWTFLFFGVTMSYGMVMRSTGDVKLPTAVSVSALVFSTFLSYSLIFGKFGLPELGVPGAAVSAVIARGLECLGILVVAYGTRSPVAGSLRELFSIDLQFVGGVFKPIFPVILNELFWSLGITAYNAIYGRIGTDAFAAVNIVSSIEQVAFTIFIAISHATSVMVGIASAQERSRKPICMQAVRWVWASWAAWLPACFFKC